MAKIENKGRLTDRKRAAILEAAVREFRSNGFDSTSMDGIATAAAVSKRTVYNHFPSKEDLFAAIVADLRDRCDVISEYAYAPGEPLERQLTRIGRSMIGMVASEEFQNLARVILSRFIQSPALARAMIGEPYAGVTDWIQAAWADGRLDVRDSKAAARQFLGLLHSLALWPQLISGEPLLSKSMQDRTVKSAVAMFLKHYGK